MKPNRLSFRIPWLVEARAEGNVAVVTLALLVIATLLTMALGLWG
jgi:hypothetical protein